MLSSRIAYRSFVAVAVVCLCLTLVPHRAVRAQQTPNPDSDERTRGINLYQQGHDKEAIDALRLAITRRKDDVEAWHYLGLAFGRQGQTNDARKAHEKAAKLGEKRLNELLESAPYERFVTAVGPLRHLLAEAADSAEQYLALTSKPSKSKLEEWNERRDLLRDYAQLSGPDAGGNTAFKAYKPAYVTTKAHILARPEPQYTEEARNNQVRGTVVLRAIFAFDGKLRGVRVLHGLPYGLTEAAIKAVRRIRFEPALIGDKPVSQYIQVEYNFNVY